MNEGEKEGRNEIRLTRGRREGTKEGSQTKNK